MDVAIRTFDPLRVACVRHVGPYQECGTAWKALMAWAGPAGLLASQPLCLGIGHDNPAVTPAEQLRYDACIAVPEDFRIAGGPGEQVLPGGAHAVVVHRGPYEDLPRVYGELMGRWLPASGRTLRGPPYEIYRNDAQTTPPAELVTEIRVPLA